MKQAHDYWQDQPGSCRTTERAASESTASPVCFRVLTTHAPPTASGCNTRTRITLQTAINQARQRASPCSSCPSPSLSFCLTPSTATLDISPVLRRAALSAHLLALSGRMQGKVAQRPRGSFNAVPPHRPRYQSVDAQVLRPRLRASGSPRTPILMKRLVPMHTHRVAHTRHPTIRAQ